MLLGHFFFAFLESSETYADPSLNEIRAKLNFSPKFFVEKTIGNMVLFYIFILSLRSLK